MPIASPDEWTQSAVADNAAATATRAGVAGKQHYVTHVSASFEVANAGKRLDLKDGAAVILSWFVQDRLVVDFIVPVAITAGNDAVLTLAASGTAGQEGAVNLAGYTAEAG